MRSTITARHYKAAAFTTLFALQVCCADAKSIYRWTDPQGQVHFSDSAPDREFTADEIPQPDRSGNNGDGLRAAETALLQQMQQRTKKQQQLAQIRRLKASREQAEHQKRCNTSRKKLQASRGHDNYKQYSRYLRNHCW